MVYILNEKQKAVKAMQDQKRYYEKKEEKIKMKALALEKKQNLELERKQKIKENKIYNFHHMRKYKPQIEAPKINDDIILNEIINSDSDDEKEPVPYEQPSRLKFTFV
jgi:hypothetical protein